MSLMFENLEGRQFFSVSTHAEPLTTTPKNEKAVHAEPVKTPEKSTTPKKDDKKTAPPAKNEKKTPAPAPTKKEDKKTTPVKEEKKTTPPPSGGDNKSTEPKKSDNNTSGGDQNKVDPKKTDNNTSGGDQNKTSNVRTYKGTTTIATFSVALCIKLTKTDAGLVANMKLGGDRATGDGLTFNVNTDGSFSVDVQGTDGTTHIQGQFDSTFTGVSGSWQAVSNTGNVNGSTFSATMVA